MASDQLNCFLCNDLLPWERSSVEPILDALEERIAVRRIAVSENDRRALERMNPGEMSWIIARNWREGIRFLGATKNSHPTFVSVFELSSPRTSIYQLIAKKVFPEIRENIHLIVHSPLNYRFFTEMEGVASERVTFVPLPFEAERSRKERQQKITVGAFGPFVSDSNLNYFLGVAHYIKQVGTDVQFLILGMGALYGHLAQMVVDLNLEDRVDVIETTNVQDVADLDILVYSPLRNDNFLPLTIAAGYSIPVLASEITGIQNYIQDNHNGFLVPVHETKPMAELVIRLAQDSVLREAMGNRLHESLSASYSAKVLVASYEAIFFRHSQSAFVKAA